MGKKFARVEYFIGYWGGTQLVTSDGIVARSASYGSLAYHTQGYCKRNDLDSYFDARTGRFISVKEAR